MTSRLALRNQYFEETPGMSYSPHGKHLIAGDWVGNTQTFQSSPLTGPPHSFAAGSVANVDAAVKAAEDAFWDYSATSRQARADFLTKIAEEIDARGEAITEIAMQETGLPEARLVGERGRTTGQLKTFAAHILADDFLDKRHDQALPDRQPLPRPDLKMVQRPIGPVAIFGASNFPLAFSTGGGDTAAALAAGCPVIFKGHSAHPGTGELVAEAFSAAVKACGLPAGTFSFLQSAGNEVGAALVQHPLIKAVGFTGSLKGGRALFDLCAARPEPIPFFGELGSVNPMFLLPNAAQTRGEALGQAWAGSLTMGAGQFCTNPGIVVTLAGQEASFEASAIAALKEAAPQAMLTDGIASAYKDGKQAFDQHSGVECLLSTASEGRAASPNVYKTSAANLMAQPALSEEVFGPLGLIVVADTFEQMQDLAKSLEGQLTCSLLMNDADLEQAQSLMPILERKAGRILANGFPTGVEVADAMVHGGPYPASTNFGATSVGTMAIRRFLRPVCYQNLPTSLVPEF